MERKKEWDEAAVSVARAVVGVMPELNEQLIRTRVYEFFAGEETYTRASYDDSNFYYVEDVKEILEQAFTGSADDAQQMMVATDVRWAFEQLSDSYKYRILERFQHGVSRPHDSDERAQLNRAIRKMTDILNTWNRAYEYEGPGSREIWSNSRSRAEIYGNDGESDWTRFKRGDF